MRIAVAGAGSIGCYVGGRLQAAGHQVVYIGRPSLGRAIAEHGLSLSDYLGWSAAIPASECAFSEDIDTVRSADIVLVTVKSAATAQMAESLAGRLEPGAVVVSLQNGIRNPAQLSRYIKQHNVITGIVGFNVAQVGAAHFHQGTQGKLSLSTGAESRVWIARLCLLTGCGRSVPGLCAATFRQARCGRRFRIRRQVRRGTFLDRHGA